MLLCHVLSREFATPETKKMHWVRPPKQSLKHFSNKSGGQSMILKQFSEDCWFCTILVTFPIQISKSYHGLYSLMIVYSSCM